MNFKMKKLLIFAFFIISTLLFSDELDLESFYDQLDHHMTKTIYYSPVDHILGPPGSNSIEGIRNYYRAKLIVKDLQLLRYKKIMKDIFNSNFEVLTDNSNEFYEFVIVFSSGEKENLLVGIGGPNLNINDILYKNFSMINQFPRMFFSELLLENNTNLIDIYSK
ncbi:MAG: hypothetical protein GY756_10280 [bacterium]|nr:hypothetical protein [bacterium]